MRSFLFGIFLLVGIFVFSSGVDAESSTTLKCCKPGNSTDCREHPVSGTTEVDCETSVKNKKEALAILGFTQCQSGVCSKKPASGGAACGSANGKSFAQAPMEDLCDPGTPQPAIPTKSLDGKTWNWLCKTDDGNSPPCSATVKVDSPDPSGSDEFCSSGLVPCGRQCDNPDTDIDETQMCNLCHLIVGIDMIIDYLLLLLGFVAFLMLVVAGIMYLVSAGNQNIISSAKKAIGAGLAGFTIVLIAWVVVNTVIVYLFPIDETNPIGIKVNSWSEFTCDSSGGGGEDPDPGPKPDPDPGPKPDPTKDTVFFLKQEVSVKESDEKIKIEVKRTLATTPTEQKVIISYRTVDGTAKQGDDYTAVSGSLEWEKDDTSSRYIEIVIIKDTKTEGDEAFQIELTSAPGVEIVIKNNPMKVTIQDDTEKTCEFMYGNKNASKIYVFAPLNDTSGEHFGVWKETDMENYKREVSPTSGIVTFIDDYGSFASQFAVYRSSEIVEISARGLATKTDASCPSVVVGNIYILNGGTTDVDSNLGGYAYMNSTKIVISRGASKKVVAHETGHSYIGLDDEYESSKTYQLWLRGGAICKESINCRTTQMECRQDFGTSSCYLGCKYAPHSGPGAEFYRETFNSIMNQHESGIFAPYQMKALEYRIDEGKIMGGKVLSSPNCGR